MLRLNPTRPFLTDTSWLIEGSTGWIFSGISAYAISIDYTFIIGIGVNGTNAGLDQQG